jgi:predicted nuclease of restriction endonuclease-like RecB superfamily
MFGLKLVRENGKEIVDRWPAQKVTYDNIPFKSKMERNVYCFFKHLCNIYPDAIFSIKYEPERFRFPKNNYGCPSYTPDFKVNTACGNFYIEVKGFWERYDALKIKLLKRDYPHIKLYTIDSKNYSRLKKLYSKKTPQWL